MTLRSHRRKRRSPALRPATEGPVVVSHDPAELNLNEATQSRPTAIATWSADAVIGATLDGVITNWNPAAARLYGYSATEAIGEPLEMLVPAERAGEISEILRRVRRTKSGRLIDVSLRISPVHAEDGQITGTLTVARDISAQKVAEAERAATHQNMREVLERITDGFYALDRDWRFTYVNPMVEQILSRTREELLGKTFWEEFDYAAGTPVYDAYKRAMAEGTTTSVELYDHRLGLWFESRA